MALESTMKLALGTPLPELELPDAHGTVVATKDLTHASALLVAFMCNHCPYVKHIAPDFGRLAAGWQAQGVAVLAVNSNDTVAYPDDAPDRMPGFAAANGWTFPYLVDESQQVAVEYGAACTPDFFLFDGDRRLAYRGRLDDSRPRSGTPVTDTDLSAAIDSVLTGRPVPEPQRPSMGCGIKWKAGHQPA